MSRELVTRATELTALLRELATDDPNRGRATVRGSAHDLVAEIDDTIRALYAQRADLCGAAREFDDATNRRVDNLLRKAAYQVFVVGGESAEPADATDTAANAGQLPAEVAGEDASRTVGASCNRGGQR